jgi:ubiquinone biosynthesis protein Coq4
MTETPLTLRQGLDRYYDRNPDFNRNQDLTVGYLRIPWIDLFKHDILHVVTGYSTALDQELRLIGFLLTAVTWKRPWFYYLQSFGVFLELLWQSFVGKSLGNKYYNPWEVFGFYVQGIRQGFTVTQKIDAFLDPETVLDRPLDELRMHYGIHNAHAWD